MTEHIGGTEWELREAENALIAAGDDPTARAIAARRHAEAIRNMMQSALVPSFERAVGALFDTKIGVVVSEMRRHHGEEMSALGVASQEIKKLSAAINVLSGRVTSLEGRMDASEADRTAIRTRLGRIEDVNERLARIEATLAERPAQRAIEHQIIADEVVQRLETRGDGQ